MNPILFIIGVWTIGILFMMSPWIRMTWRDWHQRHSWKDGSDENDR